MREARAADLIIIGRDRPPGDLYRTVDPGATILRAGRPVLAVPNGIDSLKAERVVIGWKDTREARRALRDSLPLIREAVSVAVVEILGRGNETPAHTPINDVVIYLARHGIAATVRQPEHATGSVAGELIRVAQKIDADLIVAGGYGHSRLGEWIFGGVTHGLLAKSRCVACCPTELTSHPASPLRSRFGETNRAVPSVPCPEPRAQTHCLGFDLHQCAGAAPHFISTLFIDGAHTWLRGVKQMPGWFRRQFWQVARG
jgi:nucleotide-binding universal stress UspA family protein